MPSLRSIRQGSSLLFGVALVASMGFAAAGGFKRDVPASPPTGKADRFACTVASITDGDTWRCLETDERGRQIRVRLSGVSARERDGTCRDGHPCPAASAEVSAAALERLAGGQVLTCQASGTTHRRVAAFCTNEAGQDLSCAMVEAGMAARWDQYWGKHRCG